jgi:hypothetical protein
MRHFSGRRGLPPEPPNAGPSPPSPPNPSLGSRLTKASLVLAYMVIPHVLEATRHAKVNFKAQLAYKSEPIGTPPRNPHIDLPMPIRVAIQPPEPLIATDTDATPHPTTDQTTRWPEASPQTAPHCKGRPADEAWATAIRATEDAGENLLHNLVLWSITQLMLRTTGGVSGPHGWSAIRTTIGALPLASPTVWNKTSATTAALINAWRDYKAALDIERKQPENGLLGWRWLTKNPEQLAHEACERQIAERPIPTQQPTTGHTKVKLEMRFHHEPSHTEATADHHEPPSAGLLT